MEVVSSSLQIPTQWIRENYSVPPQQVCALRVQGTAMTPTLQPGQRVYAAKDDSGELRDGAIYAIRNDAGGGLKRIETTRLEDGPAVHVRTDNPDYNDYWLRPQEFEETHTLFARCFAVGQAL